MDTNDEYVREYLRSVTAYRCMFGHRLFLLDSLTQADFKTIGTGVVFVYASWSAQARFALQTIANVLQKEEFAAISMYMVDCSETDLGPEVFGNIRYGGFGETLWLKNGQVVYTGSDYREKDRAELLVATEALLHDPGFYFDRNSK